MDDFELIDHDPNAPVIIKNRILNADFEDEAVSGGDTYASMSNWSVIVENDKWPQTAWANTSQNRTAGGKYAFNYYHNDVFNIEIKQTITGLPNGVYRLSVWSYGSNDAKNVKLYAYNGTNNVEHTIVDSNQWSDNGPVWNEFVLENVIVENGTIEIGIYVKGISGSWGYFDDFSLIKVN